jgi:hypothetical protein
MAQPELDSVEQETAHYGLNLLSSNIIRMHVEHVWKVTLLTPSFENTSPSDSRCEHRDLFEQRHTSFLKWLNPTSANTNDQELNV